MILQHKQTQQQKDIGKAHQVMNSIFDTKGDIYRTETWEIVEEKQ